jgi:hypothetical protein
MIRRLALILSFCLSVFAQTQYPIIVTNVSQLGTITPTSRAAILASTNHSRLFVYDPGSSLATNNYSPLPTVVAPPNGVGRWILGPIASDVPTIYATDFSAVGDYTGGLSTAGTGTDNRVAVQAAITSAYTQGPGGIDDVLDNTSYEVNLPKGKYYISARSDGLPSLSIPLGVRLVGEGELYFQRPPTNNFGHGIAEPNPLWCAVLAGDRGACDVSLIMIPGQDLTYGGAWYGASLDGLRVQESGLSFIHANAGRHRIFGFTRGAAIRYIGSYNAYFDHWDVGNCAYGVIMSYFGTAFNGYTRYRATNDANNVSTSLWLGDSAFTGIFGTGILIGVNGDYNTPSAGGFENTTFDRSVNGGPINIGGRAAFENIGNGILRCTTSGTVFINGMRIEEADCNPSLGLFYASSCAGFQINNVECGVTGTRSILKFSYTGPLASSICNPAVFCRVDAINVSPTLQNCYVAISSRNDCEFVNGNVTQTRKPTIINCRKDASTHMQGTSAYMPVPPPLDGGRIWSISTVGIAPLETPDGIKTTFSFVNGQTPQIPNFVLVDGKMLIGTNVDGVTVNWTWGTTNLTLTAAATKDVRAFF